jgi:8-oxo-dGTP diphosphatase
VLLARRAMGPGIGRWGFPGGMQELGETIEAGARRELLEETGIEAEPVRIIGGSNVIGRDEQDRVRAHFTLIAVLLEWRAGEGAPIEDASEVRWVTLVEAEALDTFPDALPLMRLAFGALA